MPVSGFYPPAGTDRRDWQLLPVGIRGLLRLLSSFRRQVESVAIKRHPGLDTPGNTVLLLTEGVLKYKLKYV